MLAVLLFAAGCPSPTPPGQWARRTDAEIVAVVQHAPVCTLDATLPEVPLAAWLRTVVARGGRFRWGVEGGCQEVPGEPRPEFPLCVTMTWVHREKDVSVHSLFLVGSMRTDGEARFLETPQLEWMAVISFTHGDGMNLTEVSPLSRLPAVLAALR